MKFAMGIEYAIQNNFQNVPTVDAENRREMETMPGVFQ